MKLDFYIGRLSCEGFCMETKAQKRMEEVDIINQALCNVVHDFLQFYQEKDRLRVERQRALEGTINPSSPNVTRYPYIAYDTCNAITQLRLVKRKLDEIQHPKFVDAGCGIGLIVKLAERIGFNGTGVELNPENVSVAKRVFPNYIDRCNYQIGNILEHNYSEYDCVYYYQPIKKLDIENQFEEKVENEMKVGSYLISNHKVSKRILRDRRFTPITKVSKRYSEFDSFDSIWKKVKA